MYELERQNHDVIVEGFETSEFLTKFYTVAMRP